jgi:HK97 family phage major capsid protein
MARSVVDAWLVEEQGSDTIRVVNQVSAIEANAAPEPMRSYTKTIPRSGDVSVDVVPKGSAYGEDVGTTDEITIVARKFGKVIRLAEEDLEDELVDVINEKKTAWANAYAVTIDNACLATSAAANGTTVPFLSVYQAVKTADAGVGYTANANYVATAGTGATVTYDQLRSLVSKFEQSPYYDPTQALAIAHPTFKDQLRTIKDSQGHPLFTDPINGDSATIFGYKLQFSLGAKTNATATNKPTGNPIIALGNRSLLRLGRRSGPESVVIDGRNGASALTDETLLKMRARRGFAVGDVRGWGVLELLP